MKIIADTGHRPGNEWMVDECALWNGSSGGAAKCVKYAQKHNKPICQPLE